VIKALNELEVITLFVEDLPAVKTFYTNVFGLELISADDESAVLKLKNVMINLLVAFEAHDLIAPASVAAESIGVRSLLTVNVTDAYAVISDLEQHGVKMINGPVDQPWGRRTVKESPPRARGGTRAGARTPRCVLPPAIPFRRLTGLFMWKWP